MSSLDASIVLIALPNISRKLPNTTSFDLLWILVGYQLVVSVFLVNIGRLGDMYGRVKVYNLGFAVFTASSLLCSLSQTGVELVVFRLVQGLGAAMLFSNSAAIIIDAFPLNERGRALGINQISILGGSVGGLVFGGFLTTIAGWQWIFLVNVPIGIFATLWAHFELKELSERSGRKIDFAGNISFAAALTLILGGLSLFAFQSINGTLALGLAVAGLFLLFLFFIVERRTEEPMLDVSLFKIRVFNGGITATLLNSMARGAITFVLVFYLQSPIVGLDPLQAGIYLLPQSVTMSVFGVLGGWLSDKYGSRIISSVGLAVSGVGILLLAQIPAKVTFLQIAIPLIISGIGVGLFAAPNRSSVMNSVPSTRRGLAGGISSTMLNFGMSFSRTLAFLILGLTLPAGYLAKFFAGSSSLSGISSTDALIGAVHTVYYVSAAILFFAIIPSILRGSPRDYAMEPSGDDLHAL